MTCWEILELPETATAVDVKRAYRELSLRAHPDHGGSAEAFHRLHLAYTQALELTGRPELCAACGGVGSACIGFVVVPCTVCKGAGTVARGR